MTVRDLELGSGTRTLEGRFEPFRRSGERVIWIGRPGPPGWRELQEDGRILLLAGIVAAVGLFTGLALYFQGGWSFRVDFSVFGLIGGGLAAIYELVMRHRAIYAVTDQRVLTLTSSLRAKHGLHLRELELRHVAHASPTGRRAGAALNIGATLDAPELPKADKPRKEDARKPRISMLSLSDAATVKRLIEEAQLADQARRGVGA